MVKCRHSKLILASGYHIEFIPDQEPYKSGVIEKTGIDYIVAYSVNIHYCPKCEQIKDIMTDGECYIVEE